MKNKTKEILNVCAIAAVFAYLILMAFFDWMVTLFLYLSVVHVIFKGTDHIVAQWKRVRKSWQDT